MKRSNLIIAGIVVLAMIAIWFFTARAEKQKWEQVFEEFRIERQRTLDSVEGMYMKHIDSIQLYADSVEILKQDLIEAEGQVIISEGEYNNVQPIEKPHELAKSLQEIANHGIEN